MHTLYNLLYKNTYNFNITYLAATTVNSPLRAQLIALFDCFLQLWDLSMPLRSHTKTPSWITNILYLYVHILIILFVYTLTLSRIFCMSCVTVYDLSIFCSEQLTCCLPETRWAGSSTRTFANFGRRTNYCIGRHSRRATWNFASGPSWTPLILTYLFEFAIILLSCTFIRKLHIHYEYVS